MLKVRIRKAFDFLPQLNINPEKAFNWLFSKADLSQANLPEELLEGLCNEWLLFEYKPTGKDKRVLLERYYEKNPGMLPAKELDELEQILKTQEVHLFQVYSKTKPPYVFLQSVYSGKKYKIHDNLLSKEDVSKVSFLGRVATVNGENYLVGSNPLVFPIHYTKRAIRIFSEGETPKITIEDTLKHLSKGTDFNNTLEGRSANVQQGQKNLEKEFKLISKKYKSEASFEVVRELILEEKYGKNVAGYITDLAKLGVPEEMLQNHMEILSSMWNFFPHKSLGGKCPQELSFESR